MHRYFISPTLFMMIFSSRPAPDTPTVHTSPLMINTSLMSCHGFTHPFSTAQPYHSEKQKMFVHHPLHLAALASLAAICARVGLVPLRFPIPLPCLCIPIARPWLLLLIFVAPAETTALCLRGPDTNGCLTGDPCVAVPPLRSAVWGVSGRGRCLSFAGVAC